MKKFLLFIATLCVSCGAKEAPVMQNDLRLPAVPLVMIDPFTNAWSFDNNLYDGQIGHRVKKVHEFVGAIRVDGEIYRFMGLDDTPRQPLAGMSYAEPWSAKYTFERPAEGWEKPGFNDKRWKQGEAAFGTRGETNVKTRWNTHDIWVRREIKIDPASIEDNRLFIHYSHDDTFTLYVNGHEVVKTGYEWKKDQSVELSEEVISSIKDGNVTIAAHCQNREHGGLVDFGLYIEKGKANILSNTATQKDVNVQATNTYYTFECGNVELKLTFLAPFMMDNLDLMSRPVNYISYDVNSLDGKEHDVQIYFEAAPNWVTFLRNQPTEVTTYSKDGLSFTKMGRTEQNPLGHEREATYYTNWGYVYFAADATTSSYGAGDPVAMRASFVESGTLSNNENAQNGYMAITENLGTGLNTSGKIMVGYDDILSLNYFGTNLRPYWNRNGDRTIEQEFIAAHNEYAELKTKSAKFDYELMQDAMRVGGKEYAELCASVYRQVIVAHKLMEAPDGTIIFPSKEISSGGFVSTVDVTYPSAPMFLYYNPELLKGLIEPIFYMAENGIWNKPYPAHDAGKYPWAFGQEYGEDMPIEEAGNMLILSALLTKVDGNADYATKHWASLTKWSNYLIEKGLDPANQLCTDDFAGHLARNANLSVKAILGIAAYGYMAGEKGDKATCDEMMAKAKQMAQEWMTLADAGDHYSLSFGNKESWSQKYNMVWDKLMGWEIFPEEVKQKELAYYLTKQNQYGLPLDSRRNYTKSDWIMWTATLANDHETFMKFVQPIYDFANETTDRIGLTDWYNTDNDKRVGFEARPVLGGFYIKMLEEKISK
ncbi:MAG: DUF4965 domain-containing protein [Alistipes sp.]|nr:DUF4965 domain-containing protein [Alistipes sp.]